MTDPEVWPVVAELTEARHRQGLTQRGLAARCDLRQSAIAAWERGYWEPSITNLHRWAAALGYTITARIGGDDA